MAENDRDHEQRSKSAEMIFVVGAARSGTTMMGRILGNHPRVYTFGELHFFEELWPPEIPPNPLDRRRAATLAGKLLAIQRQGYYAKRDPQRFLSEAERVVDALERAPTAPTVFEAFLRYETGRQGKDIPCLQTPRDVYYLKEILQFFRGARVVNMVRDPRAVLLSQKRRWRRYYLSPQKLPWTFPVRAWVNYHPITYSLLWRRAVAAGVALADDPRVRTVHFEALMKEPERELDGVASSLGLEQFPEMLHVPWLGSSSRPDEPDRLGLDDGVVGKWRIEGLNQTEVWLCQGLNRKEIPKHGYVHETTSMNPLHFVYYAVTWLPKLILALLLNLGRMRSPAAAVGRRIGPAK